MKTRKEPCANPPGPLVEFENITVIKNNRVVLDNLSVTIDAGENIAILGPNGAGKSSFVKTLTREYYPVIGEGSVTFRVRGKEVWDVFDLRSRIGIVSNDLQQTFAREMNGNEVVLSGYFSSIGVYNREVSCAMQERADAVMDFLEIGHLKNRPMTGISSGEARRLLIGRALINNPGTLILDEPTNSLDLHALHSFRNILRKIAQSGTGIILITHNLHDIIPEISRVILMKDGAFCRDGPKREILTDEHIGDLFCVPVHIREESDYYYATGY